MNATIGTILIANKTQKARDRQQCNGMYSKKAWGGDTDPFIETKFIKTTPEGDEDPLVSLVIFEWEDEELVGRWPSDDAQKVRATFVDELGSTLIGRVHRRFTSVTMPPFSLNFALQSRLESFYLAQM